MIREVLLTVAFAAGIPASAYGADTPCQIARVASLDIGIDRAGGAYVPMSIGGQNVDLLLDTGGIFSMLTEESVQRLGLMRLSAFRSGLQMYGGKPITHFTVAHDIVFGTLLKAERLNMLIMPADVLSDDLGGTLAPDILRAYDDEFDFANAKFNLFMKNDCERQGAVVYWTRDPYAVIDFTVDDVGHTNMPVELDGKTVRAAIDTGASVSVMSLEAARRIFDLKEDDPRVTPVPGEKAFRFAFKTLNFKAEIMVQNPSILLVPDEVSKMYGAPPLILGMGILRQLHIYIANKQHKIYVTAASAH